MAKGLNTRCWKDEMRGGVHQGGTWGKVMKGANESKNRGELFIYLREKKTKWRVSVHLPPR